MRDRTFRRLSEFGIGMGALVLAVIAWDWSRYWLPGPVEKHLFNPGNSWIYVPEEAEEGSLAARIFALRQRKEAREVMRQERQANISRWEALEAFEFAGEYFSCENTFEGRWFLHFGMDGIVRTAVPGDKRFAKDSQDPEFPVIDLGKLFADSTSYRRIDGRTIELSNANGTFRLSMTPILDEVDGYLLPQRLDTCCNRITFASPGDPEIRFEFWRDEQNASTFEFYGK